MPVDSLHKRMSAMNFLGQMGILLPDPTDTPIGPADKLHLLQRYSGIIVGAPGLVVATPVLMPKWRVGAVLNPIYEPHTDTHAMGAAFGVRVQVTLAAGTAGEPVTISHKLGRVPQAMRIVNSILTVPGDVLWYRLEGDNVWSEQALECRFPIDECELLVEVM